MIDVGPQDVADVRYVIFGRSFALSGKRGEVSVPVQCCQSLVACEMDPLPQIACELEEALLPFPQERERSARFEDSPGRRVH